MAICPSVNKIANSTKKCHVSEMAAWTDVQVWSWHESWVSHCHQLLWNTWTEKKSPPNRKSLSVQRFLYFFLKIILICTVCIEVFLFSPLFLPYIKYTYVLNTDKPLFWFYIPTYTPTIQIFTISSNSFKDCCLNALFFRLRISSVILFF